MVDRDLVDRKRALTHFGNDEALMDGLLMRFADTVQTTLTKIKLALQTTHSQDFVCYIYQIRGAASWICADRLQRATEDLEATYKSVGFGERLLEPMALLEQELNLTCEAVARMTAAQVSVAATDHVETIAGAAAGAPAGAVAGATGAPPDNLAAPPAAAAPAAAAKTTATFDSDTMKPDATGDDVALALHQAMSHMGDDKSLFHSMAQRFPHHFRRQMLRLKQAYDARDLPNLVRQAHSLKCGAAMMGAVHLSETARALELHVHAMQMQGRGGCKAGGGGGSGGGDTGEPALIHEESLRQIMRLLQALVREGRRVERDIWQLRNCVHDLVTGLHTTAQKDGRVLGGVDTLLFGLRPRASPSSTGSAPHASSAPATPSHLFTGSEPLAATDRLAGARAERWWGPAGRAAAVGSGTEHWPSRAQSYIAGRSKGEKASGDLASGSGGSDSGGGSDKGGGSGGGSVAASPDLNDLSELQLEIATKSMPRKLGLVSTPQLGGKEEDSFSLGPTMDKAALAAAWKQLADSLEPVATSSPRSSDEEDALDLVFRAEY